MDSNIWIWMLRFKVCFVVLFERRPCGVLRSKPALGIYGSFGLRRSRVGLRRGVCVRVGPSPPWLKPAEDKRSLPPETVGHQTLLVQVHLRVGTAHLAVCRKDTPFSLYSYYRVSEQAATRRKQEGGVITQTPTNTHSSNTFRLPPTHTNINDIWEHRVSGPLFGFITKPWSNGRTVGLNDLDIITAAGETDRIQQECQLQLSNISNCEITVVLCLNAACWGTMISMRKYGTLKP